MERNKRIRNERNRGITLVALVVTIIILIILATISVNMVFGDNGLIAKAKEAREHQANAVKSDEKDMNRLEGEYANMTAEDGGGSGGIILPDITPDTPAGTEVKSPSSWTSKKVTAISDGEGTAIPLPNKFYYVGGNRKEGIVISDNAADKNKGTSYEVADTLAGNQFVWIPVDNEEAITRTNFDSNGNSVTADGSPISGDFAEECVEPCEEGYSDGNGTQEIADFNNMKMQVLKYNGFYIGRYEAGDAEVGTNFRNGITVDHTVVVKKGVAPYNCIPWGKSMSDINTKFKPNGDSSNNAETHGAVYLSKNIYNGKIQSESIVSTLCYGSQWDAMCRYIEDNYRRNEQKYEPELTGSTKEDMSKNIYDLSLGFYEWTMEAEKGNNRRILRGGFWEDPRSICERQKMPVLVGENIDREYGRCSFRISLYIKD